MKLTGFHEKFTIILIPDDGGRVRQFTLSPAFIPILALLLVLTGIFLHWSFSDYRSMRTRLAKASHIQKENAMQMEQIACLTKRIDQLDRTLRKLSSSLRDARVQQADASSDQLQEKMRTAQSQKVEKTGPHDKIREILKATAMELNIEPRLALSMAKVESGFNPKVVSPKGAIGVLQITPRLARHKYGITQEMLFHPQTNIRVGLSVMKSLLERFDQNVDLALAAYNAGRSRVLRAGNRIPAIRETKMYVKKVRKAMEEF